MGRDPAPDCRTPSLSREHLIPPPPTCSLLGLTLMVTFFHVALVFPTTFPGAFAAYALESFRFFSLAPIHLCASGSAPYRRHRATPRHVCLHSRLRASGATQPQKATRAHSRHSVLAFLSTIQQVSKFIAFLCARFSPFAPFSLCAALSACTLSPDSSGTPDSCVQTCFFPFISRSCLKCLNLPAPLIKM